MKRIGPSQVEQSENDLKAAQREQREAERAERQAKRRFADDRIGYDELRLAIRRTALAEKHAEDLALILTNMRRAYAKG